MDILASGAEVKQVRQASRSTVVLGWMAIAAAVCVVVGSFSPWIVGRTVGLRGIIVHEVVRRGSDGDGWITAGLAIAAALSLVARMKQILGWRSSWVAFSLLLLTTVVGIFELITVRSRADQFFVGHETVYFPGDLHVGGGLMAVAAGGIIGSTLAFAYALLDSPTRQTLSVPGDLELPVTAISPPSLDITVDEKRHFSSETEMMVSAR